MSWMKGRALKICVLGDPGVGKTSLVRRLSEGSFDDQYKTTVGAEARKVTVRLRVPGFAQERLKKLVLWDVTGHGGPEAVGPFLSGADAALVVADATRIDTQLNLSKWVEGVRKAAKNLPVMLVINKSDIIGPGFEAGPVMALSCKYGAPYRHASARTGQNVAAAISDLVVWRQRPYDVFERGPAGPRLILCLRPDVGRFGRWDLLAGFSLGDTGPAVQTRTGLA